METYFSAESVARRKAEAEAKAEQERTEAAVAAWETTRRVELAALAGAVA
jgi:hypothetical protein